MNFNLAEKLAIVKALDEVILADGEIKNAEIDLLSQLAKFLKFDGAIVKEARNIYSKESISILKEMPNNKKHALAVLLNEMGNSDGKFDKKERKLISKILKKADIKINSMYD
ncbi:MAG: TerB family tellurite resistance protein [Maribacter sp.]